MASIAVTGPDDPAVLFAYADQLAEEFKRDPMISQATVGGFSDREIAIEISAMRPAAPRADHRRCRGGADAATALICPPARLRVRRAMRWCALPANGAAPATLATIPLTGSPPGRRGAAGRCGDTSPPGFPILYDATFYNGKRAAIVTVSKTATQDALRVMAALAGPAGRRPRRGARGISSWRFRKTPPRTSPNGCGSSPRTGCRDWCWCWS